MTDSIARLYDAVSRRSGDPAKSRTARLLRAGRAKMAKKLAEEAVEVVIDAMHGHPEAVVRESADLLYNLVVLWVDAGVQPDDVWAEMRRRELLVRHRRKTAQKLVQAAAAHVRSWRLKPGASASAADPHSFRASLHHDRRGRRSRARCFAVSTTGASTPRTSRYAMWIMGAVAFAESSFFPVPPDVMLIPMSLARPHRAFLMRLVAPSPRSPAACSAMPSARFSTTRSGTG